MKRWVMTVVVTCGLTAAPALAESDALQRMGSIPANLVNSIAAILLFFILLFVLRKMAWGPIVKALSDRESKIRGEIDAAEKARSEANAALESYQKELAAARVEATKLINQARTDAQRVAAELKAGNEAEIAALRDRARQDIESARRQAIADLYKQAAALSTAIAAKILEREIRPEDHARLVKESLEQLSNVPMKGDN